MQVTFDTGKPSYKFHSEYADYLRDADENGAVDKPNRQSVEVTRRATWDIVMGGRYIVNGFGSTYVAGARNRGPFDVDAPQNDDWEAHIQHVPTLFRETAWWRLEPRNDLLRDTVARSEDREIDGRPVPPTTTQSCSSSTGTSRDKEKHAWQQ